MTFIRLIDPSDNDGVGVGFTDRQGGVSVAPNNSFNLGHTDTDERVASNVAILAAAVRCPRVAICAQVHGVHVERVDASYPVCTGPDWAVSLGQPAADALVTTDAGTALLIRVADCVPVLFADPAAHVIAAAHAGRVGLLAGVLEQTVAAMRRLGADRIRAWIGPAICAACYEVPPDMAQAAWGQLPATRALTRQGTPAIDLTAGAAAILAGLDVVADRDPTCTADNPVLFSHRRDHGHTGRQAGVIWLENRCA